MTAMNGGVLVEDYGKEYLVRIKEPLRDGSPTLIVSKKTAFGWDPKAVLPMEAIRAKALAITTLNRMSSVVLHPRPQIRVVLIDDHETLLDSLHQWLSLTHTVSIAGKVNSSLTALEAWEALKPDVIVLSVPKAAEACAASSETIQAIKGLYPQVKIVALAWNLQNMDRQSLADLVKLVDAWVFKETVSADLLPTLAMLFPNRIPVCGWGSSRTSLLSTREDSIPF